MSGKLRILNEYVYHRRGRFSALGAAIAVLALINRPQDKWTEFEKDFKMYDKMQRSEKA